MAGTGLVGFHTCFKNDCHDNDDKDDTRGPYQGITPDKDGIASRTSMSSYV